MTSTSRLTPSRYVCRTHHRVLTDAVRQQVDQDPSVVASLGHRPTREGVVTVGSFTVDVDCPGDPPHRLRFMGTFER